MTLGDRVKLVSKSATYTKRRYLASRLLIMGIRPHEDVLTAINPCQVPHKGLYPVQDHDLYGRLIVKHVMMTGRRKAVQRYG